MSSLPSPPPVVPAPGSGAKPGSGRNNRGRGNGFRKLLSSNVNTPLTKENNKLLNGVDALAAFVYDVGDSKQTDQFNKTTLAIADYAATLFGSDVHEAINTLQNPVIPLLARLPANADNKDKEICKQQLNLYVKRTDHYIEDMRVLWRQCTPAMQEKLKAVPTYEVTRVRDDSLGLLLAIKNQCYHFTSELLRENSMMIAKVKYYGFVQTTRMTPQIYLDEFRNIVSIVEHTGASLVAEPSLIQELVKSINASAAAVPRADGEVGIRITAAMITQVQKDEIVER
jgi:hypothetical protein